MCDLIHTSEPPVPISPPLHLMDKGNKCLGDVIRVQLLVRETGAVTPGLPGTPQPGFFVSREGFPGGAVVKNLPASSVDSRDSASIPGLG